MDQVRRANVKAEPFSPTLVNNSIYHWHTWIKLPQMYSNTRFELQWLGWMLTYAFHNIFNCKALATHYIVRHIRYISVWACCCTISSLDPCAWYFEWKAFHNETHFIMKLSLNHFTVTKTHSDGISIKSALAVVVIYGICVCICIYTHTHMYIHIHAWAIPSTSCMSILVWSGPLQDQLSVALATQKRTDEGANSSLRRVWRVDSDHVTHLSIMSPPCCDRKDLLECQAGNLMRFALGLKGVAKQTTLKHYYVA